MHSEKIDEYTKNSNTAMQGGGQDRITSQHEKGKLTARDRIDLLLDEGTFVEIDPLTTHHYHEYDMQKKEIFYRWCSWRLWKCFRSSNLCFCV
jgi:acetyl-CoA/propionyl-CoA carboxylase